MAAPSGLVSLLCFPSVEGLFNFGSPSHMMTFLAPLYISRIMATWCYFFSTHSKYSGRATRANSIERENLMSWSVDPNSRKPGPNEELILLAQFSLTKQFLQ